MIRRKDRRNSPQQAYSWCDADSESRTFTNGVCERWQGDEAWWVLFLNLSRLLCEAWQLTRYSARVSVASRPRTVSSSSWDMTPSTNKAIRATGTQKPSRVRKQLLQRARRLALLVSLSGQSQDLFSLLQKRCVQLLDKDSVFFFFPPSQQ